MKNIVLLFVVISISAILFSEEPQLFGCNDIRSEYPGTIFSIDVKSGTATLIGNGIGDKQGLSGIAFDENGRLFATTQDWKNMSCLVELNPKTGKVVRKISNLKMSISSIAINPLTNVLYAIRSNGDEMDKEGELYILNTQTGEQKFIGRIPNKASGGISFSSDGKLFQTAYPSSEHDDYSLNEIDHKTARIRNIVFVSSLYKGLAIRHSDNQFFVSPGVFGDIYTLNPQTGIENFVVKINIGVVTNLAFLSTKNFKIYGNKKFFSKGHPITKKLFLVNHSQQEIFIQEIYLCTKSQEDNRFSITKYPSNTILSEQYTILEITFYPNYVGIFSTTIFIQYIHQEKTYQYQFEIRGEIQ